MKRTCLLKPLSSPTAQGKVVKKLSPHKKPDSMSLDEWQIGLRQQIAKIEPLRMRNVGPHAIFSNFEVTNPKTEKTYRVLIRGLVLGVNYCSCPDFAANTLGTCKHIERVLGKLRRQKGAEQALQKGYTSAHSSVTLRYGPQRRVAFCLGRDAGSGQDESPNGPKRLGDTDAQRKDDADLGAGGWTRVGTV